MGKKIVTLSIKGGKELPKIELPETLKDVTLPQFINFLVECRNLRYLDQNHYVIMARAISEFCNHPLADIIEMEIGDPYDPNVEGLQGSLRQIFGWIHDIVTKAEGFLIQPDGEFRIVNHERQPDGSYQDVEYFIPVITQQILAGEVELPKLSAIEVVEASEIQRFKENFVKRKGDPEGYIKNLISAIAEKQIQELPEGSLAVPIVNRAAAQVIASETEAAGDPNGSQLYSMYLKMIAVLCRKKDEKLPFDDAEREAWINERADKFRRIDAQTALNVDFFLTNILKNFENDRDVIGFLTRQSFGLAAAMQKRNRKRTTAQKRTTRKSTAE